MPRKKVEKKEEKKEKKVPIHYKQYGTKVTTKFGQPVKPRFQVPKGMK
jgi:hypothetical protein